MPTPPKLWTMADIRARVTVDARGCWLWLRSCRRDGYGQIRRRGRNYAAHRIVYELAHGPIPTGLHIDHLCDVRECVNPEHLEAVTQAENNRRMWERGRRG